MLPLPVLLIGTTASICAILVTCVWKAFLASPLFVLLEVLFDLGYKKDMHKRVQEQVNLNIAEYQATKGNRAKKGQ